MTTKFLLPVLLALCGATFVSPALAADYFCRVYSGTDTWEKATVNNGHYKITAADQAAAEKAALSKVAKLKPTATLTRARCETTLAGFAETAAPAPSAPAPAPAPAAPTGGMSTFYCHVYSPNLPGKPGLQMIPAPADKRSEEYAEIWVVPAADIYASTDAAIALAKAEGKEAVDALCEKTINSLLNP